MINRKWKRKREPKAHAEIGTCKMKGCERKIFLRGLCRYHYNMDCVKINQKTKTCKEKGCKHKYYMNGLCMMHYSRLHTKAPLVPDILSQSEPEQVLLMAVIKMYADEIIELELRRTITKDKKVRQQNLNAKDAGALNEALCFLFDGDELHKFCVASGFVTMTVSTMRTYLMEYISQRIYNKRGSRI